MKTFENLIMGNEIIFARCRNVGVLPTDTAIAYGTSGPVLQASGVPMDPRKDEPYEKYAEVEFEVPVGKTGDSYDRLWVLVERVTQSLNIIEQCMEKLPAGKFRADKLPKKLTLDDGRGVRAHREPVGVDGLLRGGQWREGALSREDAHRRRSPTSARSPRSCPGAILPDLIAIMGSIFFVVGDVDR